MSPADRINPFLTASSRALWHWNNLHLHTCAEMGIGISYNFQVLEPCWYHASSGAPRLVSVPSEVRKCSSPSSGHLQLFPFKTEEILVTFPNVSVWCEEVIIERIIPISVWEWEKQEVIPHLSLVLD
uniref:Uncharacterized protein n=1 Tax=Catharus ustulatus TaxID=91951 RepID=A0A8C3UF56_CATUS